MKREQLQYYLLFIFFTGHMMLFGQDITLSTSGDENVQMNESLVFNTCTDDEIEVEDLEEFASVNFKTVGENIAGSDTITSENESFSEETSSNSTPEDNPMFAPMLHNLDAVSTNLYVEGGSPIVIDDNVTVSSATYDALNNGNGDYNGAILSIRRAEGANVEDNLTLGTNATYTVSGGSLNKGGVSIGLFISSPGSIIIFFNNSFTSPTTADVNAILQLLTYGNNSTSPPSSVTLNIGIQGSAGSANQTITVNIIDVPNQQTASVSPTSGLCGIQPVVSLASSETNANYYLRDNSDNSVIQGPVSGTGSGVSFASETLHASKTYNVLAQRAITSGAMNFDNESSEYLNAGSLIHTSNSFTIEMWAKVNSSDQWDHVIENGGVQYNFGANYRFELGNQGELFFGMSDGSSSTDITISAGWTYGNWYHWAISYDGTTLRVYQDGVQVGSKTASVSISGRSGTLLMGSYRGSERYFDGTLDEVRIWNTARTASEISDNRNRLLVGNEVGLLVYYDFEAGSGTTVNNKVGSYSNASLVNMEEADWVTGQTFEDTANGVQMTTTPAVTINSISDQTVTISQPTGQSAVVSIANSEVGASYSLRNNADNTALAGPIAGTGSQITFPVQPLGGSNRTYNVYATAGTCNYQLTTTPTATFVPPNAGNSGGMWSNTGTWSDGTVPTMTTPVQIGNGSTVTVDVDNAEASSVDIVSGGTLNVDNNKALTIENGFQNSGTVSINSTMANSGVLFVKGTSTGTVTYERGGLVANAWSLVSAPVAGQKIKDFVENAANDIRVNTTVTPNRYAVGYYDDSQPVGSKWVYYDVDFLAANPDTEFQIGQSYAMSVGSNGGQTVTFTGTLEVNDLNKSVTADQWNAIGNPYTAYIPGTTTGGDTNNFISDNSASFNPLNVGIYVWDNTQSRYVVRSLADADPTSFTPGQGFFVRTTTGVSTLSFSQSRRSTQPASGNNDFGRSTNNTPSIQLKATLNNLTIDTNIKYLNNATIGLDPGFDLQDFSSESFDLYTKLLEGYEDINFAIQSLPEDNYENMIIPIGVSAEAGSEVRFTAEALNIPDSINVYLEDTQENIFTKLNNAEDAYQMTFTEAQEGIGRFYIRTTTSTLSTEDNSQLKGIQLFTTDQKLLKITGVQNEQMTIKIYDIQGREILTKAIQGTGNDQVDIASLSTGIYIVRLETE